MRAQEATLFFSFSNDIAAALHGALAPEGEAEVPKTRTTIERAGTEIRITIRAEDLAALRAALNSYLRWADAAERAARIGRT